MLAFDPTSWSEASWAAAGTWATVAVYPVLVIYAVKQVREARLLREEQIRPFVVVDFDVDYLTDLRIENAGSILAHNIKVTFDPPLTSTLARPWPWEDSPLFDTGIPTLAPSKSIRVHFDAYIARNEQDLDMAYQVTVAYDGYKGKPHNETYTLDLGIYMGTSPPPKGLPELIQSVDKIQNEIHKWTDGISGLRVHAVDNDKRVRRQERPHWIRRANKVREDNGRVAYLRYLVERALQRRGWID